MALPLLLLAAFVFVAGLEWGNLSLQLPRTGTWVHMERPRGASGSSLCPTEEGLGDGFCSYFRGSVVTDHHQLKSPFRNLLAGRNKYKIRNCLHRSLNCLTLVLQSGGHLAVPWIWASVGWDWSEPAEGAASWEL